MSTHASTKIDQKEYLRKYLSGDTKKKKKKDIKHKIKDSSVKVKIIDDDAHAKELDIDEELLLGGDDAPQIVGSYIEEKFNGDSTNKWKSIAIKNEPEAEEPSGTKKLDDGHRWGKKATDRTNDDFSPPRRKEKRKFSADMSPPRKRPENDSYKQQRNPSSPHRSKRLSSDDMSPPRRKEFSSTRHREMNQSPSRQRVSYSKYKQKDYYGMNWSPSRQKRNQSSPRLDRKRLSDLSPPRPRRKISADQSPSRQKRQSSLDQSPVRHKQKPSAEHSPLRQRGRKMSTDQSPTRRKRRISSDQSPTRMGRKYPSDKPSTSTARLSDRRGRQESPYRVKSENRKLEISPSCHINSDESIHRRRKNSDLSPPRRRRQSRSPKPISIKLEKMTPDSSPVRQRNTNPNRRTHWEKSRSESPPPTHQPKMTKTLDGKRAGLQDAHALKIETEERRRQEDKFYEKMSSEAYGRDAEVQIRSTGRLGRRAREALALDPEEQMRKEKHEKKKKELYDRWGKGLKQIEAHQAKAIEEQYEGSKPLARYTNDEDLERHLRDQERADDPMLEYMRKKKKEQNKNSQDPIMPVYQGSFPENRFGIRPGYRWDGVDRSNGYEKKWFDVQNEKHAVRDEAYKYSVEDM